MGVNSKQDGEAGGDPVIALAEFLPYQVILLADRISRRSAAVVKRAGGLNLSHWRVLAAVAEIPGRTAGEVVAVTPMDKGIVSRSVKTLIGEGLIERRASDSDGRLGHLLLTREGEAAYHDIARDIRAMEGEMVAGLSESELAAVRKGLAKLVEGIA